MSKSPDESHFDFTGLRALPLGERLDQCPAFLRRLVRRAVTECGCQKVWLFGSYARGDAAQYSDLDIAFLVPTHRHGDWLRFLASYEEKPETLHKIDFVDFVSISTDFQDKISQEGIVLYEDGLEE